MSAYWIASALSALTLGIAALLAICWAFYRLDRTFFALANSDDSGLGETPGAETAGEEVAGFAAPEQVAPDISKWSIKETEVVLEDPDPSPGGRKRLVTIRLSDEHFDERAFNAVLDAMKALIDRQRVGKQGNRDETVNRR